MRVPDHLVLLFGPNRSPVFGYGDMLTCAERGRVTLAGLSAGRSPRHVGRGGRARAMDLGGAAVGSVGGKLSSWGGSLTGESLSAWGTF